MGIVMSWALQVQLREHFVEQLENMREGIKHHNREAYRLKGEIKKLERDLEKEIEKLRKEVVEEGKNDIARQVYEMMEDDRRQRGYGSWVDEPLDRSLWAGEQPASREYARERLAENRRELQLKGHNIRLQIFDSSGKLVTRLTYPASHADVKWVVESLIPVSKVIGEMSGVGFGPPKEIRIVWGDRSVHVYTRAEDQEPKGRSRFGHA